MKTGINTLYGTDVKEYDQFTILKNAGFDCVMLNYFEGDDINRMCDSAVKSGLEIANIHAPIANVDSVWEDTPDGDNYIKMQKKRIDFCHSAGVSTLVLHTTFSKKVSPVSEKGISRHLELCEYAEQKNVHLAFENVEPSPHLDAVMSSVNSFHGFCWDIGHNMAYAPHIDFMETYGRRLRAVHIHDNPGMTGKDENGDDKHWVPYDGNTDWNAFAKKIKDSGYKGPLTLEISVANSEKYKEMGFERLANLAYERICRVRDLIIQF